MLDTIKSIVLLKIATAKTPTPSFTALLTGLANKTTWLG